MLQILSILSFHTLPTVRSRCHNKITNLLSWPGLVIFLSFCRTVSLRAEPSSCLPQGVRGWRPGKEPASPPYPSFRGFLSCLFVCFTLHNFGGRSSRNRDATRALCCGSLVLINYWTTREVPHDFFLPGPPPPNSSYLVHFFGAFISVIRHPLACIHTYYPSPTLSPSIVVSGRLGSYRISNSVHCVPHTVGTH